MISHVFQTRNNQEDLFDLRSKIPLIREYIKYTAILYGKVSVAKGVIVTPFLNQGSSSFTKTFSCSNSTIEALEKDVISLLFSVFHGKPCACICLLGKNGCSQFLSRALLSSYFGIAHKNQIQLFGIISLTFPQKNNQFTICTNRSKYKPFLL